MELTCLTTCRHAPFLGERHAQDFREDLDETHTHTHTLSLFKKNKTDSISDIIVVGEEEECVMMRLFTAPVRCEMHNITDCRD